MKKSSINELITNLDAENIHTRLSALQSLRELELDDKLLDIKIGPELPSYCHVHTTISYGNLVPGVFSVCRMIWAAHEAGAKNALFIEHESMLHMEEGFKAAEIVNKGSEIPLRVIFGVEFKAPILFNNEGAREFGKKLYEFWGQGEAAWVVGVGLEPSDKLAALIGKFQEAKRWKAALQIEKLAKHFFIAIPSLINFLTPEGNITDRTLSYAFAKLVYPNASESVLEQYAKEIRKMLNPGKIAYVPFPDDLPRYQDLIHQLAEWGGTPVFTAQLRGNVLEENLPRLMSWGIQGLDVAGIEPYEPNAEKRIFEFIDLAKRNHLSIFGGSDYRGNGTGWQKHSSWMDEELIVDSMRKLIPTVTSY